MYLSSYIVFAFEEKFPAKGQKLKLNNIEVCTIISLVSLDKKNNQYVLVLSIVAKIYHRYFFNVYHNLADRSNSQCPVI